VPGLNHSKVQNFTLHLVLSINLMQKPTTFEQIWPKLLTMGYSMESLPEYTAIFKPGCGDSDPPLVKVN